MVQMKMPRCVRSYLRAVEERAPSVRALRSSETCNQTLQLLSGKLIFAAAARKGFAAELRLSEKQQNRSERSCGVRDDATERNPQTLFIGQNDPARIDIEIIILVSLPVQHQL